MADKDLKWFAKADLSKYMGEEVIILDRKVVMHGKDLKGMINKFRKRYPGKVPRIAKIPEKSLLVLHKE